MCKGKKSGLKIDMVNREIIMYAWFAKQAEILVHTNMSACRRRAWRILNTM